MLVVARKNDEAISFAITRMINALRLLRKARNDDRVLNSLQLNKRQLQF